MAYTITSSGTYTVTDNIKVDIPGGGEVVLQAPENMDGINVARFILDLSDNDSSSDTIRLSLGTVDRDIQIDLVNYDASDHLILDGAFNRRIDPDDHSNYLFDFVGSDGNTYTGTIVAWDSGARDWTAAESPMQMCYAPGTLIQTPEGLRPIETLAVGELVTTFEHGPKPIRWIRNNHRHFDNAPADARPVLIRAGALGPGLPNRDLVVSPQHRMFVGGEGHLTGIFRSQVFVPAKALTRLPGIRFMAGKREMLWHHIACDAHEIIFANGCLSETILLGDQVITALEPVQMLNVQGIYGQRVGQGTGQRTDRCTGGSGTPRHLQRAGTHSRATGPARDGWGLNGPPARPCLGVRQAHSAIAARHKPRMIHAA